ncbi:MAG TPA: MBL fold metallo-hydrolase [Thermoplasmata archaeon]|nr:MBL fold metallo-hydrolase [Thermoplasmata archaeon]
MTPRSRTGGWGPVLSRRICRAAFSPEGEYGTEELPAFELVEVAEGVLAAIATSGRYAVCNAGIVDLGNATLVFDSTETPATGAAVRRAAERATGHPVAYQVNSHYHPDHIQGNAAFADVQIISTPATRELIGRRSLAIYLESRAAAPRELEQARRAQPPLDASDLAFYEGFMGGFLACPPDLTIPTPTLTFERELELHGPRRSARVLTRGGGHSPSDVVVYLPESRTLFGGDLVTVDCHPSMSDGNPSEWSRILGELAGLGIDRVVPGHGPIGSARDLDRLLDYFRALDRLAGDAREAGRGAPDGTTIPAPFSSWSWPLFFRENLAFVFERSGRSPGP